MKLKSLSSLIALSMVAGSAMAGNVKVTTDSPSVVRIGNHMMTIKATSTGTDNLIPVASTTGLYFSPTSCTTTVENPVCEFTVSGESRAQAGASTITVFSTGGNKAGNLPVKLVAADAKRMFVESSDGEIMGSVNGDTFVYSVDGGHTFKSTPVPQGAQSVLLLQSAGTDKHKRFYVGSVNQFFSS